MEIKKSPKADLERRKGTNLLMGYVVALAIIFTAFEWTDTEVTVAVVDHNAELFVEEEIEITKQEQEPEPLPEPEKKVIAEVLNIVEDDVEIEQKELVSLEDNQDEAQVEVYTAPVVEEEEESDQHIFTIVETMPEFPGGGAALMSFLSKNTNYPILAQENGVQGRVIVGFVVNKDGSIVDVKVLRGVDPSLDKEAARVVSSMPKWKPGMQRGKPVRVSYNVPVVFKLQ